MVKIASLINRVIAILLQLLGRISYRLTVYSSGDSSREYTGDTTVRTTYLNDLNEQLVKAALRNDKLLFLQHIINQDFANYEVNYDENLQIRLGLNLIVDDIKKISTPTTILDIACGNCSLLRAIKNINNKFTTIGVDVSPVRVLLNQQYVDRIYFGFAENLPIDESQIDVVVATEALEHVINVKSAIKEMVRILKPGGLIYCQVPLGEFADGINHLRHFDRDALRELFEQSGMVIDSIQIIPYLVGQEPNNIYLRAHKPYDMMAKR